MVIKKTLTLSLLCLTLPLVANNALGCKKGKTVFGNCASINAQTANTAPDNTNNTKSSAPNSNESGQQ